MMKDGPDISRVAALIGDPARTNILTALMSGKALTASELASEAGVTLQTASSHLSKLENAALIQVRKQGRHKYFTLGSEDVAHVLEALMGLAAGTGRLRTRPGPRDRAMRHARVCYNHLAGAMGTRMYDSLMARSFLCHDGDMLHLTASGQEFVTQLGLDLNALPSPRTPLCRDCLDWSDRRSHLAGRLGRGLLAHFETLGWVRRVPGSRIIHYSHEGQRSFDRAFPIT